MEKKMTLRFLKSLFLAVALALCVQAGAIAAPSAGGSSGHVSGVAQDTPVVPAQPQFQEDVNVCSEYDGFLKYSIDLILAPGVVTYSRTNHSLDNNTVTISLDATLEDGHTWADDLGPGWTQTDERTASYEWTYTRTPCTTGTVVVVPELPTITQPACAPNGMRTGADLELPADTDEITYSIQSGTVAPGQQVIVHAQLAPHAAWDQDPDVWPGDWFPNSDVDALLIIDFDDPDCEPLGVVAPDVPAFTEPTCTEDGQATDPIVTLPADTNAMSYSIQGDLIPGGTVTIIATLNPGYVWATSAGMWTPGWTVESDTTASMTVLFSDPDCGAASGVVPESPVVTQAACLADGTTSRPELTLPADTDAIMYSMSGDVVPGGTAYVTATLVGSAGWNQDAGAWPAGWHAESDTTALFIVDFDDPTCEVPSTGKTPGTVITQLPKTGSGVDSSASTGLAMLLASLAGAAVVFAVQLRRSALR